MIALVSYICVAGAWAFVSSLGLLFTSSTDTGEVAKVRRTFARGLILTPIWPIVALWAVKPIATSVWKAADWRRK